MTLPFGVGRGSTSTLKVCVPTKIWSRCGEFSGKVLPLASTLVVLSSSVQVAPPSIERRKPTPSVPVSPSPVPAKTMDWLVLLFRPKTARPPMLMPNVGPKSVSGTYVGPCGLVVRKFVVFQTPPLAPATYTVLPDGSDGSTVMPPMRPPPLVAAGPTDVQALRDPGLV